MAFSKSCAALLLAAAVSLGIQDVKAEEAFKPELDALRESLAKYKDVFAAVREGYFSTVG